MKCTVNDGRGGTADASGNVEVKEPPQVHELETKLALHSIYFPTAQPTEAQPNGGLLATQAATLDALAGDYQQYLKFRPAARLILEGHADSRGAKEYNMKLSERRVERARSYLVEKGVPADHLEIKAFGFEKNMTSDEVKKLLDEDPDLSRPHGQQSPGGRDTEHHRRAVRPPLPLQRQGRFDAAQQRPRGTTESEGTCGQNAGSEREDGSAQEASHTLKGRKRRPRLGMSKRLATGSCRSFPEPVFPAASGGAGRDTTRDHPGRWRLRETVRHP